MKGLSEAKLGISFDSKETVLELNGCTIEEYPSNHIDALVCLALLPWESIFSLHHKKGYIASLDLEDFQ